MKKILTFIVLSLTFLAGCNKRIEMLPGGSGSMTVALDDIEVRYITKSGAGLDVNEFNYEIVGSAGNVFASGKVGEMPSIFENVPVDRYTINVSSQDVKPAAFDQPIIAGSQEFAVAAESITSVVVNCSIRNVKVTIRPDEKFFDELALFTVTISNGEGADNRLIWTNGELQGSNYELLTKETVATARAGYFTPAPQLDIKIMGYRVVSGQEAVYEGAIVAPEAKDHYAVNLYASTTGAIGGTTTPGIKIEVDYTTNDKDEFIEVPGFENPPVDGSGDGSDGGDEGEDEIPGLSLEWAANPTYGMYELKSKYEDNEVNLTVKAENHIKSFKVKITSPSEGFLGAVKAIAGSYEEGEYVILDLLNEETATAVTFLPSGDALRNKAQIDFPLGDLLPLILAFSPEIGSVHTFVMEVTDTKDQVLTKELLFEYKGN